MRLISTVSLGLAVSSLMEVASAIKYTNVKLVPQTPQFRMVDSQSTRLIVSHTLPVLPNRMSLEGVSTMHVHWKRNETKPCSECLLKYASVSLRGTGQYGQTTSPTLDKFTLSIEGPGRKDAVCGDQYPDGERIVVFAKGGTAKNEKYFFTPGADRNAGVWLGAGEDKLSMALDVGDIAKGTKNVVLDVTFEFIPADKKATHQRKVAAGFKTVKGVFLDIASCGSRAEMAEESEDVISGSMTQPWVAPFSGRWLSAVAQDLSIGGRAVEVSSNGEVICSSTAIYADEDIESGIERYEGCADLEEIKQGDAISMKALYEKNSADFTGGFAGYVVVA